MRNSFCNGIESSEKKIVGKVEQIFLCVCWYRAYPWTFKRWDGQSWWKLFHSLTSEKDFKKTYRHGKVQIILISFGNKWSDSKPFLFATFTWHFLWINMKGQEMRLRNSFVDERSGTGPFCMPLNDGGVRDFVGADLWQEVYL